MRGGRWIGEWLSQLNVPALLISHGEGLSFPGGLEGSGEGSRRRVGGELWLLYKMNRNLKREKVG